MVENIITLKDAPDHKAAFLIGLMVGMGIEYSISPDSPLYRMMREKKKELLLGDRKPIPNDSHKDSTLTILGKGASKSLCQFDTDVWSTVSILGCEGWEDKPYSKLFVFDRPSPIQQERVQMAKSRNIPVMGRRKYAEITEPYPKHEVIRRFGSLFFMNSVSYMLALALYEGYKHIALYGLDKSDDPERQIGYDRGRPYVTYWLGVATGLQVSYSLPESSRSWLFADE